MQFHVNISAVIVHLDLFVVVVFVSSVLRWFSNPYVDRGYTVEPHLSDGLEVYIAKSYTYISIHMYTLIHTQIYTIYIHIHTYLY
jgi:hypothetical protein